MTKNEKYRIVETASESSATFSTERVFIYILTFNLTRNLVIPFYVGQAINPIRRFENHTRIAWHYGKFIRPTKVYIAGSVHKSVADKAEQDMISRLSMIGYSLINIAISDAFAQKIRREHDLESWTVEKIYEYSEKMPTLTGLSVLHDWQDNWKNKIISTKTTKYMLKPAPKRSFSGSIFQQPPKLLPSYPENKKCDTKFLDIPTPETSPTLDQFRTKSEINGQSTTSITTQISKRQLENYIKLNLPIYKKMTGYPKPARNPDKNKLNGGPPTRRPVVQSDVRYEILDRLILNNYNEITGLSLITIPETLVSVVYDYLLRPNTIWRVQHRDNPLSPILAGQPVKFELKKIIIRNIGKFR
jgi:hypothetical protein